MTTTRKALDSLCDALTEARSFTDTCLDLAGDQTPPWVYCLQEQLSRIEKAAEVLEVQLRTQVLPQVEPLADLAALFVPESHRGPQATE